MQSTQRGRSVNLKVIHIDNSTRSDEELQAIMEIRQHPDVTKNFLSPPPTNFQEHKNYLVRRHKNDKLFYLITDCDTQQIYGYCQKTLRTDENDSVECGWAVHPKFHGQGIGSAAVKLLIDTIPASVEVWLTVKMSNLPAIHIYKKYGFVIVSKCYNEYYKMVLEREYA